MYETLTLRFCQPLISLSSLYRGLGHIISILLVSCEISAAILLMIHGTCHSLVILIIKVTVIMCKFVWLHILLMFLGRHALVVLPTL